MLLVVTLVVAACGTWHVGESSTSVACDCGPESVECKFQDELKQCMCKLGFSQNGDRCQTCDCGPQSTGCTFQDGMKQCMCMDGVRQIGDRCQICDCGDDGQCNFNDEGNKVCTCDEGYRVRNGRCEVCDCGEYDRCILDVKGNKVCPCIKGYRFKDGGCEACDCLDNGQCTLDDEGNKACTCDKGYSLKNGRCLVCDSGDNGKCHFDEKGNGVCTCKKGYSLKNGRCEVCNCGDNGQCTFDDNGKAVCSCDERYSVIYGKCKACHCGPGSTGCTFKDEIKQCVCKVGFSQKGDRCQRTCRVDSDCANHASCKEFEFGGKFCACTRGLMGDACEVIVDCIQGGKYANCRDGAGSCEYDEAKSEAICRCATKQIFYKLRGTCLTCDCGENSDCLVTIEDKTICACKSGYNYINGKCQECDCGPESIDCKKDGTKKKCTCKAGFIQYGMTCQKEEPIDTTQTSQEVVPDSTVTWTTLPEWNFNRTANYTSHPTTAITDCYFDSDCGNGGICVTRPWGRECVCRDGYGGRHCEVVLACQELSLTCRAIGAICKFDAVKREGYCDCPSSAKTNRLGICKEITTDKYYFTAIALLSVLLAAIVLIIVLISCLAWKNRAKPKCSNP